MRTLLALVGATMLAFGLAACGDDDRTVVVPQPAPTVVTPAQPAPNTTVVNPGGTTKVCPAGTVC